VEATCPVLAAATSVGAAGTSAGVTAAAAAAAFLSFFRRFSATVSRARRSAAAASALTARFFHLSRFDSALASSDRSPLISALPGLAELDLAFFVAIGLLRR
jgi:hypothetical protein